MRSEAALAAREMQRCAKFQNTPIRFVHFFIKWITLTFIPPPALEMTLSVLSSMTFDLCFSATAFKIKFSKSDSFFVCLSLRALCLKKCENICILCIQVNQMSHIVLQTPQGIWEGVGRVIPVVLLYIFATMTSHWVGGWCSMHFSCLLQYNTRADPIPFVSPASSNPPTRVPELKPSHARLTQFVLCIRRGTEKQKNILFWGVIDVFSTLTTFCKSIATPSNNETLFSITN